MPPKNRNATTNKTSEATQYLLIVESPGKIKKIQSFLPKNYIVAASVGHVRDLASTPKYRFGIDIENDFQPIYKIDPNKREVVARLKQLAKNRHIILAADEDREGEAIADSLREVLNLKVGQYSRILFNQITKEAILDSLDNRTTINQPLVDAQVARRILDRIVGFELSPLLKKIPELQSSGYHNLGTGRVQSVVVRLVVEREQQIEKFLSDRSEIYFSGSGLFDIELGLGKKYEVETTLYDKDGNLVTIQRQSEAATLLKKLSNADWTLTNFVEKIGLSKPSAPFTTSTLQQTANSQLGFSVKKTMTLAQKLYEEGLITYMRTDSTTLSAGILQDCQKYISQNYGSSNYQYTQYQTKSSSAQEAHEAIRPTSLQCEGERLEGDLQRLYRLIFERTVGSQMVPANYQTYSIELSTTSVSKKLYVMSGKIRLLLSPGYLVAHDPQIQPEITQQEIKAIQKLKTNDIDTKIIFIAFNQTLKQPPSRYSEASLVKELESRGIGRPSTYVSIITRVQDHSYIELGDIDGEPFNLIELKCQQGKQVQVNNKATFLGRERKRLKPTLLGKTVNNFLTENFSLIVDYQFTQKMEENLDMIANKEAYRTDVLNHFYQSLQKLLSLYSKNVSLSSETPITLVKRWQPLYTVKIDKKNYLVEFGATKYGKAVRISLNEGDREDKGDLGKAKFISFKHPPTREELIEHLELEKRQIGGCYIKNGPYGYYLLTSSGDKVSIPKSIKPNEITSSQVQEFVNNKKKIKLSYKYKK